MSENNSDEKNSASGKKQGRSPLIKTIIFIISMAAIFLTFTLVAQLDHPIDMPKNADHIAPAGNPNPYCKQCHPADSLPKTHPQKVKRAECTRCHKQTQKAIPEQLRKK